MQKDDIQNLDDTGESCNQNEALQLTNSIVGNKYVIKHVIGQGSHSTLYYGLQKETRQQRIFKYYNFKQLLKKKDEKELKYVEMIIRISKQECKIMKRSNSTNTAKCLDVYQNHDHKIIVMEYCNEGTLKTHITGPKNRKIDQTMAIVYLKQIVDAVNRLNRDFGILMTNLKLENIMVRNGVCKLIDFGFINPLVTKNTDIFVPQIYQGCPYNLKAQVWCIGALFYQIIFGRPAYFFKSREVFQGALKQQYQRNEFLISNCPEAMSFEIKDFLQKALIIKTQNRMKWEELYTHPVFDIMRPKKDQQPKRVPQILPIFQSQPIQAWKFCDEAHYFQTQSQKMNNLLYTMYKIEESPLEIAPSAYTTLTPNRSQINQYNQTKQLYLQFLIKHTLFKQLVEPLLSPQLLSKDNKQQLFFMYLLMIRLCKDINQILQRNRNHFVQESPVPTAFRDMITPFANSIESKWQQLRQLMMISENSTLNIVATNFSKLFSKGSVERKNKFFTQMEGQDYTRQQQICYTYFYYANNIEKDLRKKMEKSKMESQQILRLVTYLQNYTKLCNLSSTEFSDYPWITLSQKMQKCAGVVKLL